MAAQQVYQILNAIRGVHRQLAERFRELDEAATDQRIQFLLEDMERRERKFDDCVGEYASEEDPAVLESWLQFVPDETTHIDHISERLAEPQTLGALVEETLRLNSSLSDAYLILAEEAPTEQLKDLFMDLARMEERNDCHYAKVLLDA